MERTRKGNSMRTAGFTRVLILSFVVTIMMLSGIKTFATTNNWNKTAGGSFGVAANWDGGVPGEDDEALFALGEDPGYTVVLDQERTNQRFNVSGDMMTLDLNGKPLNIIADYNITTYGLAVGYESDATMVIEGGESVYLNTFVVGYDSTSTLILQGSGTRLYAPSADFDGATLGKSVNALHSMGTLEVRDGAQVNVTRWMLGRNGTDRGTLRIIGSGSSVHATGTSYVGYRGEAHLIVLDGGYAGLKATTMGDRVPDCSITVSNGTLDTLNLGMGRYSGNTSTLTVIDGGVFTTAGILFAGSADGSTVSVLFSGTNENGTATSVNIGDRSTGTGRNGLFGLPDGGAAWDLTISDHAEVDFAMIFSIHPNGTFTLDNASVVASQISWYEGAEFALVLYPDRFGAAIDVQVRGDYAGDVALGESTFTPTLADDFDAELGDEFTVLRYEGALTGTFKDRPDGQKIQLGNFEFELDYGDGSDDAITLTCLTAKGTLIMVR